MFLKNLKIESQEVVIRDIPFHKGMNLIIDETVSSNKQESGNNVGKTTVLRLIDFCLGGKGENIYRDTEFASKSNTQIERFLKENNIIITLTLKEDIDLEDSGEIVIKKNFGKYSDKIQQINGEAFNDRDFPVVLKKIIFKSESKKPSFRQIISKNIRDEKNKLNNTVKVLHHTTTGQEYEALFLFWLGIDLENSERKQNLLTQKKIEENLQKRLRKQSTPSQINQSIIVLEREIEVLEQQKTSFNINENYEWELSELNNIKSQLNDISNQVTKAELRKQLILESKTDLESEVAKIDSSQVRELYEQAKSFIPTLQTSFDETLNFHNQMISERISYITKELPKLDQQLSSLKRDTASLLESERDYTNKLNKSGAVEELQKIINQLNKLYQSKGSLEGQMKLWEDSSNKLEAINEELSKIDQGIEAKDDLIQSRITDFNKYFSDISSSLYGEQFILSSEKKEKGYELNISSISGNLGTGKKKGQIAAFDLAYIKFADELGIDCLHFILHDQLETVHGNQILSLITEIVSKTNCQYIVSVLQDKLPRDIDLSPFTILSLSQKDKLFRVP